MMIGIITVLLMFRKINDYTEKLYMGLNTENKYKISIEVVQEASKDKSQVNWMEVLAIAYVIENKEIEKINRNMLRDISEKFIETSYGDFKTKTIENVMKDMKLSKEKQKEILEEAKIINEEYNASELDKSQVTFIEEIEVHAKNTYLEFGILPSIVTSQAILESGWGKSYLTQNANNLFGIKADDRWEGEVLSMNTKENYDDNVVASFRKYNSYEHSINDYGEFLNENKRYKEHGVFESLDYTEQAKALENAGYSTKKNKKGEYIYADMLIEIIQRYNLQLLDIEVKRK